MIEKGALRPFFCSVPTATEYENERDNYKPHGAVIKKIAKTVVHKKPPFKDCQELCALVIIICAEDKNGYIKLFC